MRLWVWGRAWLRGGGLGRGCAVTGSLAGCWALVGAVWVAGRAGDGVGRLAGEGRVGGRGAGGRRRASGVRRRGVCPFEWSGWPRCRPWLLGWERLGRQRSGCWRRLPLSPVTAPGLADLLAARRRGGGHPRPPSLEGALAFLWSCAPPRPRWPITLNPTRPTTGRSLP